MNENQEKGRGAWMQTFSRTLYYPTDPKPEDVSIKDIAHALSRICRFGGHVKDYYCVAQHSVLVSRILPEELALWGLMHDAAEAYVGDLIRPVKYGDGLIHDGFTSIEDLNLKVIVEKYGMEMPMPEEVRMADDIILATEIRDLMNSQHVSYGLCDSDAEPMEENIIAWSMDLSKELFLRRFKELTTRRENDRQDFMAV